MTRVSDRFLQLGVLFALTGMGLGVWMGASEDIRLTPVHAHINLLGWVSMMLYGLFYRAVPKAAVGVLPAIHFWLALVSLVALIPLLALNMLGAKEMAAPLGVASIALWVTMALFAVIVFKATWKAA